MNRRVFASALALCFAIGANAQWTVVNLHPAGSFDSYAFGLQGSQQVGTVSGGGTVRASLWSGTAASWMSLHPAGAGESHVYSVGDDQQVGWASVFGPNHASLWSGTAASWIDLHPVGANFSWAYGVSGGQQVGAASFTPSGGSARASLWTGTAASCVSLHPAGESYSFAYGVSGGQQVGYTSPGNGVEHACLWSGSAASWVSLHPTGAIGSIAYGVSDGQQVGQTYVDGFYRASLWSGSAASWVDLTPAGATHSRALGVSGGQQVGWATIKDVSHAVLWSGTAASWVDLDAFLPAHLVSSEATGIWRDASGTYVVGHAWNTTAERHEALMWVGPGLNNFLLLLNKSNVAGQNSVQGTVLMGDTKATNTVFTTYDNSSLVTTPPSVTVPAGAYSRTFQIAVTAITSTVVTTIFAKRGTLTRSQSLTLMPLIPTAVVSTPNPVTGGQTTSCRVVINGVAGPGGREIAIFDNSIYATLPSTVTVPAGATQMIFPITTIPVTSTKTVTVTARVSAGEKTGTFRINP